MENIAINKSNRTKRGLINGLGSVIKDITGNLDFQDGEKINKILNHLEKKITKFTNLQIN